MSTTLEPRAPAEAAPPAAPRSGLVESLLDNLPVWTIVAAAISFLYLVWATLEVLSRYVGGLPKVTP